MTHDDLAGIRGLTTEASANPAAAPQLRAAFIAGLRDLASFLEANPDLPVRQFGDAITLHTGYELPADGTWEGELRALEAFAAAIGTTVTDRGTGHLYASRSFGPITYEAAAISPQAWARHRADWSYHGNIQLDGLGEVA